MGSTPGTPGPLASHWQAGGWFGSQLGGTAWMFVSALVLAPESLESAAVLLGCGLASNLVGLALWSRRSRLDPYRALQVLVVAIVALSGVAVRWLEVRDEFGLLDPRVSPRTMYLLLLLLSIVLVTVFESRRRAATRGA